MGATKRICVRHNLISRGAFERYLNRLRLLLLPIRYVFLCHASSRFSCICSSSLWAVRGVFQPPVNLICITRVRCVFHGVFIPLVYLGVFQALAFNLLTRE